MRFEFDVARRNRLMSAERRLRLPPGRILAEIGLRSGQILVDIGAGPGFFALPAAAVVGPRGRIVGLDVSPVMIEELRKNAARKKLSNLRAVLTVETAPDFPAGADFYLMVNVLHEMDDPRAYLRRIRRSMSARSRLVVIDFLKKKTSHGPPLRGRISFRSIGPLAESAGLDVERVFRPNAEEYGIIARRTKSVRADKTPSVEERDSARPGRPGTGKDE